MCNVSQSNDTVREILVREQMCQTNVTPIISTEFLKHKSHIVVKVDLFDSTVYSKTWRFNEMIDKDFFTSQIFLWTFCYPLHFKYNHRWAL